MALAEDSLHADPDERPPPLARSIEPRPRVALFGATLLYALLFAGLTADYRFAPRQAPAPEEIPVEIVPEPEPPPPQPQAQETPKPQPSPQPQQPEYIPPAYDAPRVGKSKDKNSETVEKSEQTPPTPVPQPSEKPQPEKSEAAAKEEAKAPDAEKPAPDAPPAPVADGETPPQKKARAKPPAEAAAPSTDSGIVFNSGPDPGAEVMEALTAPGRERLTYLTHLYGLIIPHRRLPSGPSPRSYNSEGAVIVFDVDGRGRLTYRSLHQSSGWREFDVACLDSLEKALPFPPPPHGAEMALEYHCSDRQD